MKLRVALCAAVFLCGTAAFAQLRPWVWGPYDKLQPYDARVPQPLQYVKPERPAVDGVTIIVPKKTAADPRLIQFDAPVRVNYFKLSPLKSKAQ